MVRCVYTILTGGYEQLNEQPAAASSDIPFICFTDNPALTSDSWQMRRLEKPAGMDAIRAQRTVKLLPQQYLPEFEQSLYIDNSVLLKTAPERIFAAVDLSAGLALPWHSFRQTLLDEFLHVARDGLDSPALISAQLKAYRALYPEVLLQRPYWNGMLLRDHRNARVTAAMDFWLAQIYQFSRRDQLSAPIAFAQAGLRPQLLALDNYDSAFHSWPHASGRNAALRLWQPKAEWHGTAPSLPPLATSLPDEAPAGAPPPLAPLVYKKPGWRRWLHGVPELSWRAWRRGFAVPFWRVRAASLLRDRCVEIVTAVFKDFFIFTLAREPSILAVTPGQVTAAGRAVALYVHFSRSGIVSDMAIAQLEAYRALGFDIVFISNAPGREAAGWAQVHALAALVIERRNLGYDFGAWKDALPLVLARWPRLREVLLVNDSCLGPFRPLGPALAAMRGAGEGMFGMQESLQGGTHLQSWFVLLRGGAAIADLARFFERFAPSTSKWKTVQRGELKLSRMMLQWGHQLGAVHEYAALVQAALDDLEQCVDLETMFFPGRRMAAVELFRRLRQRLEHVPLNPTHHLWCNLLKSPYCCFIKAELVAKNPGNVPRVERVWRQKIPVNGSCPLPMLEAHLGPLAGAKTQSPPARNTVAALGAAEARPRPSI